ncbi:MAG: hypothetical protein RJA59_1175 [Pseudomonadota bacterium]
MASKRTKAGVAATGTWGRGMKRGFVKGVFSMDPDQLKALRRIAALRMAEKGSLRADSSELVREAVAEWLKKHGR